MKENIVKRWITKAENDLKIVQYMININDTPVDLLGFHCQQAVEKYLKAFLTSINVRVIKTHDIETILNQCREKDNEFEKLDKEKISALTIYATNVRYPEDEIDATIDEIKVIYELTKITKDFVRNRLEKMGFQLD